MRDVTPTIFSKREFLRSIVWVAASNLECLQLHINISDRCSINLNRYNDLMKYYYRVQSGGCRHCKWLRESYVIANGSSSSQSQMSLHHALKRVQYDLLRILPEGWQLFDRNDRIRQKSLQLL